MPIYSNPAFGQAAENLMKLFEPPSGSEAYGWAKAKAEKENAQRLADQYAYAFSPEFNQQTFDRGNIGAGLYGPNQSYHAVEMDDATKRYDVDSRDATSRANNAADNAALYDRQQLSGLQDYYKTPLSEGQIGPAVPAADAARIYGSPNALPQREGREKPFTAEEQRAEFMKLLQPNEQRAVALGSTPVQEIIGENGQPQIAWQADSIGKVPYSKPSDTKYENYLAIGPAGEEKRFLGYIGDDGSIYDASTRQPVPNVVRKEGTGGGMSFETDGQGGIRLTTGNAAGLTTSRVGDLQRQETENARAVAELTTLFNTLRPDDLGVAGNVNELLTDYGSQMFPTLARPDVAGTRAQLGATTQGIARAIMQDERLSDSDRRAVEQLMVSRGFDESLAGARAKLATLIAMSAYRQKFANTVRTGGERLPPLDRGMLGRLVDENAISPAVAQVYAETVLSRATQSPNGPLPGVNVQQGVDTVMGGNLPTISSQDEAMRLPSGTRFRAPDGSEKVRP